MTNILNYLRRALCRLWNKQFLVFLFFLALSTAFWLFQTLNEVYEHEFEVPIEIKGLPRGVVVTSDVPAAVRLTLKDRGVTLLNYMYGEQLRPFVIDASAFTGTEGYVRYLSADILRQIRPRLAQGTQVIGLKPDTLELYYNHGRSKRVPVKIIGQPTAASGYTITGHRLTPDSITVFAANALLDTIRAVYVRTDNLRELARTTTTQVHIIAKRGVKFTPADVRLTYGVDRLVEKKFEVNIQGENFPDDIQLRTFPTQVEVAFQVSMSLYRSIKPEQFTVVVDYRNLPLDGSTRCRLELRDVPAAVSHVRLLSDEVEYVLETNRR